MYQGDVLVEGEKITTIGTSLDDAGRPRHRRHGQVRLPGRHRRPHAPRHAVRRHDVGRRLRDRARSPRRYGGTTTIVDFAIQYRGQTLHHAWETWMKKAEGKAAIDYGFHMIITELNDQVEARDGRARPPGRHVVQAVHGLPRRLHARRREHLQGAAADRARTAARSACTPRTAASSTCSCKQALAEGKTAPKYHALTRPARAEAEATHRAIALAEIADVPIYIVHLSAAEALEMVTEARDRGLPAYAETCPQYLFLSYDNYEEPGFDGAKYVMSPPLRAEGHAGPAVARPRVQRPAGDLDRPLPVLHEGAEGRSARTTSRRSRTARPASRRA